LRLDSFYRPAADAEARAMGSVEGAAEPDDHATDAVQRTTDPDVRISDAVVRSMGSVVRSMGAVVRSMGAVLRATDADGLSTDPEGGAAASTNHNRLPIMDLQSASNTHPVHPKAVTNLVNLCWPHSGLPVPLPPDFG
jgi:hypothetical protein